MKTLLKVMLGIAAAFASTFLAARALGLLTQENIRQLFEGIGTISSAGLFAIMVGLLFVDLFVAVPTLTIVLLGSYFLGFELGLLAAITGSAFAALSGYAICRRWGDPALARIVRDERQRHEMRDAFKLHGPGMIVLARAVPILPEVTACMAGITAMPLRRYTLFWTIGTLPYVTIASYAGSISTLDDPRPAIYAALGLYAVMWAGWSIYRRRWMREVFNDPRPRDISSP